MRYTKMYLNPNKNHWPNLFFINTQSINASLAFLSPALLFLCFDSNTWKIICAFSGSIWKPCSHPAPCPSKVMVSLWPCNTGPDLISAPGGGWPSTALNNATAVADQPLFPSWTHRGWKLTHRTGHLLFFSLWKGRWPQCSLSSAPTPLFPLPAHLLAVR